MPKSKKKKRQDFQKVKLKVGKKLPKGDNVTNLSFKTRQIQLTQRKKGDDEQSLVTKKKQSAQDLLRQCDHHSSSSRLNAVMGLRELWLNNYTEMMIPTNVHGYTTILKKISCLLIDTEATVRHAVINLFKLILNKISKSSGTPFTSLLGGSLFAHLHAYLCCAMNHVLEDIRLDALLLFDALLEMCPELMVQQTGGLLRNLVSLLVTPNQDKISPKGTVAVQKLSLNPESRLPIMVFWIKVLSRIRNTLEAALTDKSVDSHEGVSSHSMFWSLHDDHYDRKDQQSTLLSSRHTANKFKKITTGGSHELDDYITNPSSLESFTHQCIPVLIQCWKEAQADHEQQKESANLLSPDAVEVVSHSVAIIQYLCTLSSSRQGEGKNSHSVTTPLIAHEYLATLEQLMMGGFPYSAQLKLSADKKKKKKDKVGTSLTDASLQTYVSALNLGICDIMSCFYSNSAIKVNKKWFKKMGHHIKILLSENPSVDEVRTIVRILKNVFLNPQLADTFIQVYKMVLKLYKNVKLKSQQKRMLYDLFSTMIQSWDGWSKTRHDSFLAKRYKESQDLEDTLLEFAQDLPQLSLSLKAIGDERWTLKALRLMCHGHVVVYKIGFNKLLPQILDPMQGLFASGNEEIQHQVCAIISSETYFSKDDYRQLLQLIRCPPEKPVVLCRKSYSCMNRLLYATITNIRTCVPLKSLHDFNQMSVDQHQCLSDYLRFLFSLQLGYSGEELDLICPVNPDEVKCIDWLNIDFSIQEVQWKRHLEIALIVASEIAGFSLSAQQDGGRKDRFSFMNNFEHFWKQTFNSRKRMPILSVISLVRLVLHAQCPLATTDRPGQELLYLAALAIASALADLYHQQASLTHSIPTTLVWQIKAELVKLLVAFPRPSKSNLSVVSQSMDLLCRRSKGDLGGTEGERQAAKSAHEFLLTDDFLKHNYEQ